MQSITTKPFTAHVGFQAGSTLEVEVIIHDFPSRTAAEEFARACHLVLDRLDAALYCYTLDGVAHRIRDEQVIVRRVRTESSDSEADQGEDLEVVDVLISAFAGVAGLDADYEPKWYATEASKQAA